MTTALALRHVAFEDLGAFAAALQRRGFDIRYVDAPTVNFATLPHDGPAPLFILGGPIGACEEALYPFLESEVAFIANRLAAQLPTFGICLGAQLMARALGARVYPAPAKELGWAAIRLTEAGRQSCLQPLGSGPALHWHGDTFDLPPGATRLASTALCKNQAFSYGGNVLALQFHIEVEAAGLERWYVGHAAELAAAKISVPVLRAASRDLAAGAAARGEACLEQWLDAI